MRLNSKQARALGIVPEPPRGPRKRQKAQPDRKAREALILAMCDAWGLPNPAFEVVFHPERKWRFDLLWEGRVAAEIQGGLFTQGRHVRGRALLDEYEKLNEAAILGYRVLFLTWEQINSGEAFALVERALTCGGVRT